MAPASDRIVAAIGADDTMHADFGTSESDKGPYPIPKSVALEGGRASDGDRHALIVDRDSCKL